MASGAPGWQVALPSRQSALRPSVPTLFFYVSVIILGREKLLHFAGIFDLYAHHPGAVRVGIDLLRSRCQSFIDRNYLARRRSVEIGDGLYRLDRAESFSGAKLISNFR